jgi:hypothetical protein
MEHRINNFRPGDAEEIRKSRENRTLSVRIADAVS